MRIDRIRMQGYRSLYDVEFEPGSFTVLAGPNNAGKSNLVDALDFLADAYRNGLKKAVDARGGIGSIGYRRDLQSELEMAFDVEATIRDTDAPDWRLESAHPLMIWPALDAGSVTGIGVRHTFFLESTQRGAIAEYAVVAEDVRLSLVTGERPYEAVRFYRKGSAPPDSALNAGDAAYARFSPLLLGLPGESSERTREYASALLKGSTPSTGLMLERIRLLSPAADRFADRIAQTQLYRLTASSCRAPGVPAATAELAIDGHNLPSLLYYLREQHKSAWTSVLQAMTQVVPDLEDIRVEPDFDGRLTLRFIESGVERPWSATEISDGTIRALGLFAALYDPRRPFIVVEEPENSVHPWMVRVFIDACREVTSGQNGKQVVLTTHSPVVLNYVAPDDVSLVWREQGRTSVSPLLERDPQAAELWASGESTVFGLLDSGWLRESVPGGA